MPTRNRRELLESAVGSVLAQTHQRFELIVVDDGSSDDTPTYLAGLEDPRVRSLRVDLGGGAGARNCGLDIARGDIVAYLDDDNLMFPGWLRAVAWGFDHFPEHELLYGAIVIEHEPWTPLPSILFVPFERDLLERTNFMDMNAIAHRRGIADGRLDERLPHKHDWDLALRLTARQEPLALPAFAALYRKGAPDRLSDVFAER
jgi:glycosyltransferase involved in cell wall biosynthesis